MRAEMFKPHQAFRDLRVWKIRWIPARIERETSVKQVQAYDFGDLEAAGKQCLKFGSREQMGIEADMPSVGQIDLEAVLAIILTEISRLIERAYEDRGRAAHCANGDEDVAFGDARQIRCRTDTFVLRQMVEHAVKAKDEIIGSVILVIECMCNVGNIEADAYMEIAKHCPTRAGQRNHLVRNIEASPVDGSEAKVAGARRKTKEPGARAAPRIENTDRVPPARTQPHQLGIEPHPYLLIGKRVSADKIEEAGVPAIGIFQIFCADRIIGISRLRHDRLLVWRCAKT